MNDFQQTQIALFKGKQIRKTLHNNEWWFSIVDVVEALTDSVNARDYWFKMKIRVKDETGVELSTFCRQLKLEAPDGKMRETDCHFLTNSGHLSAVASAKVDAQRRFNHYQRPNVFHEPLPH
ncbi:MAG: hypothetical protein Q7N87_04460 [Candidatus Uhrbacteria bacterium]|nr:hypothetical protein [Candidatus Uhrbacteria bacterium]